jgi:hypothetical protein
METLPDAIMIGLSQLFDKVEESCGFMVAWIVTCASATALLVSFMWLIGFMGLAD